MKLPELRSAEELQALVQRIGFLPFFKHEIPGFSVEECCPRELWFAEDVDGPWEWKGPVARSGQCVYGKFFRGKAGFISIDWFPDFANYRRDGYDVVTSAYHRDPKESRQRVLEYLTKLLPEAADRQIEKLLK